VLVRKEKKKEIHCKHETDRLGNLTEHDSLKTKRTSRTSIRIGDTAYINSVTENGLLLSTGNGIAMPVASKSGNLSQVLGIAR